MNNSKLLIPTAIALLLNAGLVSAQPGQASPNQFGDRQAGNFGDPGNGHFGDPGAGNFDNAKIKEPAPGTEPQGKVYRKSAVETSEYLALPADKLEAKAAPEVKATAKASPASEKRIKRRTKR